MSNKPTGRLAKKLKTLGVLVGLAIAGPALTACGPPITAIEMAVEDRSGQAIKDDTALKASILADINNRIGTKTAALMSVDVYEGRVMLTGAVEKSAERSKIIEVVKAHPDTNTIFNEIQVVDPDAESSFVDDVVIDKKFYGKLASTSGVSHTNWRWRSVNGTLYLFGRALSQAELNKVVSIARDTENVRKVVNHAIVRPK